MHKFLGVRAASTNSATPLCTACGGSTPFSSCSHKSKNQELNLNEKHASLLNFKSFLTYSYVYEIAELYTLKHAYLFRDVLWGDAIDPAYHMLNICGDFLFEVSIIQTTATNSSQGRPKRSSPRPRYQLITEKHS